MTISGFMGEMFLRVYLMWLMKYLIFYLSRPNVKQPILTQYCDGKRVSCPNWLASGEVNI